MRTHVTDDETTLVFRQTSEPTGVRATDSWLTYHGVLAGNAAWRSQIVPVPPDVTPRGCLHTARTQPGPVKWPRRWISWAQLLFRVFGVESLRCDCGAWMGVHAIVIGPPATQRALKSLQPSLLRCRAPPGIEAAA